ncbi:hypothetical protein [Pseudomonas frederiksbergensis]|uniref:hypothetical protein n=1 Tax=Pseudomonas frederiksbergensis TaxID=104087 RepID=UPI003D1FCACA
MPWYKSGTVSVTQNSNAVIGIGTAFISNGRVGDAFRGPDGGWYEVTNIASDTAISISPPYKGATTGAGAYALAPMQGYVKDSADALRGIVTQYGVKLAALGTTGNYEVLPVEKGGTAAADPASARANLGLPLQSSPTDSTSGRVLLTGSFGLGGIGGAPIVTDLYNGRAFEAVQFNSGTAGGQTSFGCALRIQGSSGEWRNILQFGTSGELNWTSITNPSAGGTWRNYTIYHSGLAAGNYIPTTLQNNYSTQPSRLNGYRMYLGKVELKMNIVFPASYTDGMVVTTLPAGFRTDQAFAVPGTFGARVVVNTDGTVAINGGVAGASTSFAFEFKPA